MSSSASNNEENGPIEKAITQAIVDELQPIHYEVLNESYMHNVPKGAETHFKVLVVSKKFESLPLIKVIPITQLHQWNRKKITVLFVHFAETSSGE